MTEVTSCSVKKKNPIGCFIGKFAVAKMAFTQGLLLGKSLISATPVQLIFQVYLRNVESFVERRL